MVVAPKTPSMILSGPTSIVNAFVKVREVTGDVACLNFGSKNFEYRGILKVNSVNFSLMSEDEQEGVIEGFKGFMNGISFPIQILIRNRPHNLDHYLQTLESVQGHLAPIAQDHADFVRKLAARRALVKREFYIIVPADKQAARNKTEALINAQMQLKLRLDELLRQLERMGLTGKRLNSLEIVQLYQSCYTPWEARERPTTQGMLNGSEGGPMVSAMDSSYPLSDTGMPLATNELATSNRKSKKQKKQKQKAAQDKLPSFVKLPDLITPSLYPDLSLVYTHRR